VNADDHALMSRMHGPGQEKRMLALRDPAEYDEWLERPLAGPTSCCDSTRRAAARRAGAEAAPGAQSRAGRMAEMLLPGE
jgi:hypothetical protein